MFLIFLFASLAAGDAHASVNCTSLWALGFPQHGAVDPAEPCYPFEPQATALGSGQEMYFQGAAADSDVAKTRMEWAAEAFAYASSKYSAFASVPKIRIVFAARPYGADAAGSATRAFSYVEFFQLGNEFCPVVLYPSSAELDKEHFYQLVAHEIYHCVQKVEFPDKTAAVVQHQSEGQFWYESIAQFMSNDVYPLADFEYHPIFGRFDSHLPFFDQASPYLSEGFFQGLFWHLGSSLARMHAIQGGFGAAGATSVDDALSIPRISEAFHETARGISFGELNDSSGAPAPWTAERQMISVPVATSSNFSVSFMDFATEPFEIDFPKRGRYRLNVHSIDGAKLSVRKTGTTPWLDSFDTEFRTECDAGRKLEGIFTRVSPDLSLNSVRVDVQRFENEECPCDYQSKPADECLLGSWQVEPESVASFMRQLVGAAFEINSVSGGVKLTFTGEGAHSWDYQNLIVNGKIKKAEVVWRWNGVNTFAYSSMVTEENRQMCTKGLSAGVVGQATMTVQGHTMALPGGAPNLSGEGSVQYHCDASTLTYETMAGPVPMSWVFRRAGH